MALMESFTICLHVFSGLQDPQWVINRNDPNFSVIADLLTNHINTQHPSILGYKGYTVELMHGGQMVREYTVGKKKSVELERKLLESAPEEIKQKVGQYVNQALANN